ncbi:unnamed protein product [Paramecium primaurelia]|uniref:Uncharacterized protein n=1 Tax=Paramecium primaurelia TaxID=5886 RepID=A0A8S1M725_PARPR|nr:unnamed protein product [Paramecium primaurelia]
MFLSQTSYNQAVIPNKVQLIIKEYVKAKYGMKFLTEIYIGEQKYSQLGQIQY